MAIEPITFEDLGTPINVASGGGIEPIDPTILFGEVPVVVPTPAHEIKSNQ